MTTETIISIFLGIGLSASVGFRVFVPLFALSLAAYFNLWELNESWLWIGSLTAVVTLGVATLVEIFGYYIPYIDNLLDSIAIPLATIAGTAVMVSTVADLSPAITWALAIIVSLFIPVLAFIFVIILLYIIFRVYKKIKRSKT